MQVLIMRHGNAFSKAKSDSERSLTDRGRNESSIIARWLSYKVKEINFVLVSPYLRARQTFNILQEYLVLPESYKVLPELIPSGDSSIVNCYLKSLSKEGLKQILLISHLPLICSLLVDLCQVEQPLIFSTSSVANIDIDTVSGNNKLLWQIEPIQLLS
ncbi:Phosphohistidine phosphatase SixA [Candidatus Gullanella endobia]|uniref:Phosphohistidine phosphatase SixA n=1 Tax=Candidatus Gullanella endobia TaxID=1070130 RepID=A0A143WQM9_9ENTR|nr:phosphohistidine phosphatase SixA [Candidatus Gullanella endobia]CUX96042.1 Phosphohistidine phosphatase SixA [Candidatus Gullanella endobia]